MERTRDRRRTTAGTGRCHRPWKRSRGCCSCRPGTPAEVGSHPSRGNQAGQEAVPDTRPEADNRLLLVLTLRLVWKPHSSPSRALHGSRSSGWFANWRTLPAAIAPPSRSSVCRRAEHLRLVPELAAGIRGSDRNQDAQHDAACYPKSAEYHAGHRHPPPGLAAPLDLPHRDHAED